MSILFTVCGRAGSKGIKNKNIRDFLGYPLPYYTFAAIAQYIEEYATDHIDVAVNTDSTELIKIADDNPFVDVSVTKRRAELGGDRVPKPAVILDTFRQMQEKTGRNYDMVVDLDLTSPLRTANDINSLVEKQKIVNADVTFSVTDSRRNPFFNMVMDSGKGVKKVIHSDFVARQQAPAVYDMNASLYAYNPAFLQTGKGVLDGYCEIIHMYDTGILDLDHENDFELMQVVAEYLFQKNDEFSAAFAFMKRKLT